MIASSLKGKILVFCVFFIGIATGALIANFYDTRVTGTGPTAERVQRARRDINKFYDYLGLNPAQRVLAEKIGEETRTEFQMLRKESQPRFQAIQQESRTKIRAILTDEQREKYDEFHRARDERFRNRERDSDRDRQKK